MKHHTIKSAMRPLLLLMAITLSIPVFAGNNPLRLKSGSLTPLKDNGGKIFCEIDLSKCRGNRKPFEQHLIEDFDSSIEEFNREFPTIRKWFCERWDDDIEKGPKISTDESAPLRMKIVVKNCQMGAKSGFGGASISGYAEFYHHGEDTPFAVIEILKIFGTQMKAPVAGYLGVKQAFNDLAEYICDLIYHN